MFKSFYDLFNWYEYLVRGEWTPDGQLLVKFSQIKIHSQIFNI